MSETEVGRMIIPVSIIGPGDVSLKEAFQPQGFAKLLKKEQSAMAG
jgi:hypothetical protein